MRAHLLEAAAPEVDLAWNALNRGFWVKLKGQPGDPDEILPL
jgi:hypothetical protein